MPESMGLGTWLKQNRLRSVETKLKGLRARQKHLREEAEEVLAQKRKGTLTAEEAARKEDRLHDEREKLTKQVHQLMAEEERLKAELKALERDGTVPS